MSKWIEHFLVIYIFLFYTFSNVARPTALMWWCNYLHYIVDDFLMDLDFVPQPLTSNKPDGKLYLLFFFGDNNLILRILF